MNYKGVFYILLCICMLLLSIFMHLLYSKYSFINYSFLEFTYSFNACFEKEIALTFSPSG